MFMTYPQHSLRPPRISCLSESSAPLSSLRFPVTRVTALWQNWHQSSFHFSYPLSLLNHLLPMFICTSLMISARHIEWSPLQERENVGWMELKCQAKFLLISLSFEWMILLIDAWAVWSGTGERLEHSLGSSGLTQNLRREISGPWQASFLSCGSK